MGKRKKNITRKIKVVKLEEKQTSQVKKPKDYKPAILKMYTDENGNPLDLSELKKAKRGRKKLYLKIIVILLFIFGAAVAGFFVFYGNQKFKEGDVVLDISGPEEISSGDEVVYQVNYSNQGKAFLGNLEITATYPEGFTFKKSVPAPDNNYNQYWKIGNLSPGKNGKLEITGKLVGEVGSVKDLTIKLSYKPSNFNSLFETEKTFSTRITDSIVDLRIESSKKAIPNREISFKIKYKNNSEEALEKIKIIATYPEDYEFITSTPETYEKNNTWQIERLEPGAEGEIEVRGKFQGTAGDMRELKVELGLIDESGEFIAQVENSSLILLVEPELFLELKINGKSENISADPGETLTYYLSYENNSDIELRNVSLSLEIDSDQIDWSSLDDEAGGRLEDKIITWTKDQIDGLDSLKPGDSGEIILKLKINKDINLTSSEDKNLKIDNVFSASSDSLSELGGGSMTIESETVTVKINSRVTLNCEGRYYSEEREKLGEGPLPPQVGETTTYRIFWYLSNTTNDLSEVEVKSSLPEDIYWTGKNISSSTGDLSFDPITREITWKISRLPAGTGRVYSQLSASFEVSTTPTEEDLGLVKVLCDKTTLSATDDFTSTLLSASCDSITSDLKDDIYAQGKGIVVKGEE